MVSVHSPSGLRHSTAACGLVYSVVVRKCDVHHAHGPVTDGVSATHVFSPEEV